MVDRQVISKLYQAVEILIATDHGLLEQDLSEWSITHKLAEHMQQFFNEYNVDCEYNGNVDSQQEKKRISILKSEYIRYFHLLKRKNEQIEEVNEQSYRAVFPDIIVHQRGSNNNNKLIVEVKKDTSRISQAYDIFKLKKYTDNDSEFKYELGALLVLHTGDNTGNYKLAFYSDGNQIIV